MKPLTEIYKIVVRMNRRKLVWRLVGCSNKPDDQS